MLSCDTRAVIDRGEALSFRKRSEKDQLIRFVNVSPKLDQKLNGFQISTLSTCLLYTSPSPRDQRGSRMPSSA